MGVNVLLRVGLVDNGLILSIKLSPMISLSSIVVKIAFRLVPALLRVLGEVRANTVFKYWTTVFLSIARISLIPFFSTIFEIVLADHGSQNISSDSKTVS